MTEQKNKFERRREDAQRLDFFVEYYVAHVKPGKILFEIPDNLSGIEAQFNFGSSINPIIGHWNIPIT